MSVLQHNLEEPDLFKTEGYRLPNGRPSYSPIDLSVALFETYRTGEKIKNLKKWFQENRIRQSEHFTVVYVEMNDSIVWNSVTVWKKISESNEAVRKLFQLNAPLTWGGLS